MLLSEPLESLITFYRTSLTKFYLNSQRMSDSFYDITELSELNWKIRIQNILCFAMFENFCVGWRHDVNIYTVRSMTLSRTCIRLENSWWTYYMGNKYKLLIIYFICTKLNRREAKPTDDLHGGESRDTTTTTDIWQKSLTSGKKIFNNSVNTWPIGIWFEAEKVEGLQGFAWYVRFFKQHLIKKLLTSKQIFYPG